MVDVTLHAQLRWLERVEGLDVAETRRRVQRACPGAHVNVIEGAVLHELLQQTGRTNLDLINTILTPQRRMTIECGAVRIILPDGCVMRIKNGRVCTVARPVKKFAPPDIKRRRKRNARKIRRNGYV